LRSHGFVIVRAGSASEAEPPAIPTSALWRGNVPAGGTRASTRSVIAAAETAAGTRTQSITSRYGL